MESEQKSKQFCSVCKEWLDMEVVPTGDGDDDGVIWYRCPQCQGFLPKLSNAEDDDTAAAAGTEEAAGDPEPVDPAPESGTGIDDDLLYDSPAEMMAAEQAARDVQGGGGSTSRDLEGLLLPDVEVPEELIATLGIDPEVEVDSGHDAAAATDRKSGGASPHSGPAAETPAEPIAEYAARLEEALSKLPPDEAGGNPYRPWETYELDQCIQHLAWDDCGIVVGKESLPGGRRVIKVFFQDAGVVRLIEQAPQ